MPATDQLPVMLLLLHPHLPGTPCLSVYMAAGQLRLDSALQRRLSHGMMCPANSPFPVSCSHGVMLGSCQCSLSILPGLAGNLQNRRCSNQAGEVSGIAIAGAYNPEPANELHDLRGTIL